MVRRALPLAVALITAGALAVPHAALAQGKGRPKAPKAGAPGSPPGSTPSVPTPNTLPPPTANPTPSPVPTAAPTPGAPATSPSVTSTTLASVTTFRQFGAWLDDASATDQGSGYISVGMGYWRLPGISQTNVPMLGGGIGLTDRFQLSASVPFYRYRIQGTTASGLDDVYISAKYTIFDPTLTISEFGLAVSPVVEILSAGIPDGRVHFAVPVNIEARREPVRVYGSAGYFTRGSFFSGGAVEWTSPAGVVVTGALTQSYSMKTDLALDRLEVTRHYVYFAGSIARAIGDSAAAYVSIGRSMSGPPELQTNFSVIGGVSLRFSTASSVP